MHNAEAPRAGTAEFVRWDPNEEHEQLAVGPPLTDAVLVTLKPQAVRPSPHAGPALPRAVLVRQEMVDASVDRAATSTYMRWQLMRLLPDAYVYGLHAIDLYAADETQLRAWLDPDAFRGVPDKRIGLGAATKATAASFATSARPAVKTTMYHTVNPHWLATLHGLSKAELRQRVLEERNVPARIAAYGSTVSGFVVGSEHFTSAEEAERVAAAAAAKGKGKGKAKASFPVTVRASDDDSDF